jgi:hypothetical protein
MGSLSLVPCLALVLNNSAPYAEAALLSKNAGFVDPAEKRLISEAFSFARF